MNGYKEMVLSHAAKGSKWKNHKYIAIVNGRYIYPGDKYKAAKKEAIMEESRAEAQNHGYGAMTETRSKYNTRKAAQNYAEKSSDDRLKVLINAAKETDKIAESKKRAKKRAQKRMERLKSSKAYQIEQWINAGKQKAAKKKADKAAKKAAKELAKQEKAAEKNAKNAYKDAYKQNKIKRKNKKG